MYQFNSFCTINFSCIIQCTLILKYSLLLSAAAIMFLALFVIEISFKMQKVRKKSSTLFNLVAKKQEV